MTKTSLWDDRIKSWRLWFTPGIRVKRYVLSAMLGALIMMIGGIFGILWLVQANRQIISAPIEDVLVSQGWSRLGGWLSGLTILLGAAIATIAVALLNSSLLTRLSSHKRQTAVILHERLALSKGPHIVAIGGGTGLSNLLRGLRQHSSNITAVVAVSDDGGSSGRLRTAFDMPPPGDLVDCLAALSDLESEVSKLLEYRFERGNELKGHTFGNLFITTLTEVEGNFAKAIRVMNSLLNICGAVYPVSAEAVSLRVQKDSGQWISGESQVSKIGGSVSRVTIEPKHPALVEEVGLAISEADIIVLGPGSLFTSVLPPVLVPEAKQLMLMCKAPIIYICNVMTEVGETDHFDAWRHVEAIAKHLGRYPDWVIVNSTPIDLSRLASYTKEGSEVVKFDAHPFDIHHVKVAYIDVLRDKGPYAQHDSDKLAKWLISCAKGQASPYKTPVP
ncbi:MAG: uridine diphosphate-N-acetylglucosamine-binding protein YvcK [Deinococcales bacterium]